MESKKIFLFLIIPIPLFSIFFEEFFFFQKNVNFFKDKIQSKKISIEKSISQEKDKKTKEEVIVKIEEIIPKIEDALIKIQKFVEEKEIQQEKQRIQKIKEKSENLKGVYITSYTANSKEIFAEKLRDNIFKFIEEEKINSVVIDVKEAQGPALFAQLKDLISELHQKNTWCIARIVVFRDDSLIKTHPEFYLKRKIGSFWQDNQKCFWLDPASQEVQDYIIDFSKEVIDFGFDELQFDYIRFPSDGDLKDIVYPFYDGSKERVQIIGEFISRLNELKDYKKEIILSIDLFGYIATQFESLGIGQRLKDCKDLDYISFMLYPSHFYGGFGDFPYQSENIEEVVSNHPYEVVFESIQTASDYLESLGGTAKIRPWLQAFDLKVDTERGIFYDAEKITAQIKAAQDANSVGYLLWNPTNVYSFLEE